MNTHYSTAAMKRFGQLGRCTLVWTAAHLKSLFWLDASFSKYILSLVSSEDVCICFIFFLLLPVTGATISFGDVLSMLCSELSVPCKAILYALPKVSSLFYCIIFCCLFLLRRAFFAPLCYMHLRSFCNWSTLSSFCTHSNTFAYGDEQHPILAGYITA